MHLRCRSCHLKLSIWQPPVQPPVQSRCFTIEWECSQGAQVVTPAYKWLRAVGDHEFTGLHIDRVFMGRSARMLTAWIPLGSVPINQGPVLVSILSLSAPLAQ